MHRLLERQIKRHLGNTKNLPESWRSFLEAVEEAYRKYDFDYRLLERAQEVSEEELALQIRQKEALLAELENKNASLRDFASIASHDLNEPIRKIISFGKILQDRYTALLDDKARDYLARMVKAAERMHNFVHDLLLLSRLDLQKLRMETVDLRNLLREVLLDLELRIAQTSAEIVFHADPGFPEAAVEGDHMQMQQLLQNLVSNAIKYCPPERTPKVTVTAKADGGDYMRIEVRDNGIGFESKYAERIFKPFERLHGKNEFGGTGLGLSICQKIVHRHGGRIFAEGRRSEGALFTVILPRRQGANPSKPGSGS